MKRKENQGSQYKKGNSFFQFLFNSSQGFDDHIGDERDPQGWDLQDEIGTFTRNHTRRQIAHQDDNASDHKYPYEKVKNRKARKHSEDDPQLSRAGNSKG